MYLFIYLLVGLGFEPSTSSLQNRCHTRLIHTSIAFYSGYFGDGVLRIICLAWPQEL
jgi:hypothetical protein